MLHVPINRIKPGMTVARPICHSRSGVHYVQGGYVLDRRTIARLTELGVHSLWIACGELSEIDGPRRVGKVIFASKSGDAASHTFRVKLEISNPKHDWIAGVKVWVDFRGPSVAKRALPGS